jgi:protein TonB
VPISFTLDNKAAAPASDRPVNKNQVYKQVDEAASFPGGVQGLYAFLVKTVHYPALAREKNVQGKVFVSFVVEEDGELTGIQVKRGIGAGCDEEAVRALQNSPKWIPARLHGENVKEEYVVPISFSLVKS